jgi:transcriptional regulator with XRE-family HTH domain
MSENARVQIGAQLRRLRVMQDVEAQVLARELNWSGSKISRIEQGKINISVQDLGVALDALGASEEIRAEMLATVAADKLGAWMIRSGGTTRRQMEVGHLEQRVSELREFHPLLVPGLLQSRAYTRAMALAAGFDPDNVMKSRAARQALLAVEGAPQFHALLDARAFARWAGSASVMVDQIDHLLNRMLLPNVTVRLIPNGPNAKVLALGAFVIYTFHDTSPVVLLEHHAIDVFLATTSDVSTYRQMFTDLGAEALSTEETAKWLISTRNRIGTGENG